jgi:hypothetical protein
MIFQVQNQPQIKHKSAILPNGGYGLVLLFVKMNYLTLEVGYFSCNNCIIIELQQMLVVLLF